MVLYQKIGVNREAGLGARVALGLEKMVPVAIVQENRRAPVSPAHDVINGPGIFTAQRARHERILPRPAPVRKPIIDPGVETPGYYPMSLRDKAARHFYLVYPARGIEIGRILTLPPIGVPRLRGFLEQGSSDRLKAELRTGHPLGLRRGQCQDAPIEITEEP